MLRDAGLAISLLTLIPTPARWPEGERTDVAGWFPFAGAILGGMAWAVAHLVHWLPWDGRGSLVIAALVVAAWALLTRFLHFDGLADVADAMWGGHTAERRLEIMKDSATGAFGATAVALVAIVEVAAVTSLLSGPHELPLLVVPILARCSATFAAWLGSPARDGGLGRSVMSRPTIAGAVPFVVVLGTVAAVLWVGMGVAGAAFIGGALVLTLVVPHVLSGQVGGVTGDIMGASVLICEALLLAVASLLWGA